MQPVRHAVSAIGANGLPFLIARLNYRESALHQNLRHLADKQPFAQLRLADPRVGRDRAIRALTILGPAAQPAIPDLVTQLADPFLSSHAIYALAAMGPEGLRGLVSGLTNQSAQVRTEIGVALMSQALPSPGFGRTDANSRTNDPSAAVIVAGLIRMAQDSAASGFRFAAIHRLGMLGPVAIDAIPILLPMLGDQSPFLRRAAIDALVEIRAPPELLIPLLTNRLNDPDLPTREAAFSALLRFGYVPGSPLFGPPGTNFLRPAGRSIRGFPPRNMDRE